MKVVPSLVYTREQLKEVVDAYLQFDSFAIDVETMGEFPLDPRRNEVFWVGLAGPNRCDAIPMQHPNGYLLKPERIEKVLPPEDQRRVLKNGTLSTAKVNKRMPAVFTAPPEQMYPDVVFEMLEPLLFSDITKTNHNLKFDIESISKYYGETFPGPYEDTLVMQFLVNENRRGFNPYSLGPLIEDHFKYKYDKLGKKGVQNFAIDVAGRYAMQDATWDYALCRKLKRELQRQGLEKVFAMEMSLMEALVAQETAGVCVDTQAMKDLGPVLERKIRDQEDIAYTAMGYKFSMSNNTEKVAVIFGKGKDQLGLKPKKFTANSEKKFKEGLIKAHERTPSVDAEALGFHEDNEVVAAILNFQKYSKTKSTYVDGMGRYLVKGRFHPNFQQARAVTGRLSCSEPNLHNITRGSELRSMFVAPPGQIMLVADYDQIELRVIAHYSRDKTMMQTFINGDDIHAATAATMLGVTLEEAMNDVEIRTKGKVINFAVSFSAGATTLAKTTGGPVSEAQEFLNKHRAKFPAIYRWKDDVVREAKSHRPAYITTMLGRKRRLPDLWAESFKGIDPDAKRGMRMRAERQAVNARVQGSAADIFKLAMIRLYEMSIDTPLVPVLNVHDELACYCPPSFEEEGKAMMNEAMAGKSMQRLMRVPLAVKCGSGERWSDAK